MPGLLNSDGSFSSKQELLDLQDCTFSRGHSQDTPSDVDSQTSSPSGSGTKSPQSPETPGGDPSLGRPAAAGFQSEQLVTSDPVELCGWGAFKPKCIQVFNHPIWALVFLCVASFLQGMIINGFINTVVTSIEKRFDLPSYEAGLIASSYDIAACICLAFVSYFGGTGHKPRWLGWGLVIMAAGSLVFALPHFTAPPYHVNLSEPTGLCSGSQVSRCKGDDRALSSYRLVFMLGQFLHGMGATPLYTLGVTYLDENVKSSYAPVYIGIFYTAAILGPAAGYLLGGYFLNIYTNITAPTEMTPENPLWVGAWWIGFLLGGGATALVSFPILGFPRQLPGSQHYKAMRVSEAHQIKDGSHIVASDPHFGKTVKDMPRSVLLLLKNSTFLFLCLAGATEATLLAGMSTFGAKFLEFQFSLSASEAAMWFGIIVVPAGGGGTFLGGYIVKRLNLRCQGIIRFCMLCMLVSLLSVFIFFIHCPDVPMAGVTAPYPTELAVNSSAAQGGLTAGCNAACSCSREQYSPVCGDDGLMYHSACHAGCTAINSSDPSTGKQVYSGCSCVAGNVSWGEPASARAGKCGSACHHMPYFLFFFFVIISFTFLSSIPALTATLRCVPDSQRSFGLGIQWIVVRVLGGIPGPIAFGSMIDRSCVLWQNQCMEQGSCYLYHNSAMSRYLLTVGVLYKALGLVFFLLASVLYHPPPESPETSSKEHTVEQGGGAREPPEKEVLDSMVIANPHAE
ncbi:solute carrier organic anion transporter family member 4A1 [Synchiropus picturatus]